MRIELLGCEANTNKLAINGKSVANLSGQPTDRFVFMELDLPQAAFKEGDNQFELICRRRDEGDLDNFQVRKWTLTVNEPDGDVG